MLERFGRLARVMERRQMRMRRVQIENWDDYVKAFDVLIRVGGTFMGRPEQVLIVTEDQYQAPVDANVVSPDGKEAKGRGKKATKQTNV
jgi:hypothetical protein